MGDPVFLRRVVLTNFKSIKGCFVNLGPLTFLVGQNGAGKSNFLDALRLVTEAQARCGEELDGTAYYDSVAGLGLEFGESFRGLQHIWRRDGEALGELVLPEPALSVTSPGTVWTALTQPDGRVLIAGTFTGVIESYLQSKSARVGAMIQKAAGGLIFFAGCYILFQGIRNW